MEEIQVFEYMEYDDLKEYVYVAGGIALRFGLDENGCYVMELHSAGAYAYFEELPDEVVNDLRELIRSYDNDTEEKRDVLLGHYFGETDQDMICLCLDGVLSWQVGDNTELKLVNPSDIDKLRDFFTTMSSGDNGDNGDGDVQRHTETDDDHGGVSKSV